MIITKYNWTSCSQNSYAIFGVEATANCYCGNTLVNGLASAPSDDCKIACVGNPQEICGANWRINIYSSIKAVVDSGPSPSGTSGGGGLSRSDRINLGVGIGVGVGLGLPSLLFTIFMCLRQHGIIFRLGWRFEAKFQMPNSRLDAWLDCCRRTGNGWKWRSLNWTLNYLHNEGGLCLLYSPKKREWIALVLTIASSPTQTSSMSSTTDTTSSTPQERLVEPFIFSDQDNGNCSFTKECEE